MTIAATLGNPHGICINCTQLACFMNIYLTESIPFIREGIKHVLQSKPDFKITETANLTDGIARLKKEAEINPDALPNTVLIGRFSHDLVSQKSFLTIKSKLKAWLLLDDLVCFGLLRMYEIISLDIKYAISTLELNQESLNACFLNIEEGKFYYSPEVSQARYRYTSFMNKLSNEFKFTKQEENFLLVYMETSNNKTIAERMGVSESSARNIKKALRDKLQLNSTEDFIEFCKVRQLIGAENVQNHK